ncbi:MAG: META domain-containing protein [Patescibacteria group bacterium]
MQKTLLSIGGVLIILVVGFFVLNSYIYNEKQAGFTAGDTVSATGTVLAIDLEQVAFDGPFLITLKPEDGKLLTIAVPSMGLQLCEAYKALNIGDVSLIKVGDEFEVRGIVGEDGSIVPCESADHYLRPTPLIVEDFEGEADPKVMTLNMKTWNWIYAMSGGEEIQPKAPGIFTLTFGEENRFTATTDCNAMSGSYSVGTSTIAFSKIISTKKFCSNSQESDFASILQKATGYHFTSRGQLILDFKTPSDTAEFN